MRKIERKKDRKKERKRKKRKKKKRERQKWIYICNKTVRDKEGRIGCERR